MGNDSRQAGKGDKERPCNNPEHVVAEHHKIFGSKCLRCHKVKVAEPYMFCDKCLKDTE